MNQVKAKKSLGQHFLKDLGVAKKIADTIQASQLPEGDGEKWGSLPVVEVGPGMGVLSRFLKDNGREVKAVELDPESVAFLRNAFPELDVVEGDFLKIDLDELFPGEMVVIGNYPYNISSQIFFKVLDNMEKIPFGQIEAFFRRWLNNAD